MKHTLKNILLLVYYWYPVVLGWSIALVIHKATGLPISPSGLLLYLLGIWAAYSLDRLVDSSEEMRSIWLTVTLGIGFLISAALGTILALQLPPQTISIIVLFAIITIFYPRLKKIPFLKAVLVAIVWTWAGVALPFQNQNWFAWQFWLTPTSLPLVILIATGVILCDFKDIKSDGEDGVNSLPVMFGSRKTILAVCALILIAGVIAYEQGRMGLVVSSVALIGLAQFPFVLSQEAFGSLLVDTALALPGILIVLHLI